MWTESYPELRNTFSQANTAYRKGKVSTKYISAMNNILAEIYLVLTFPLL
jgi:hypothetical protein